MSDKDAEIGDVSDTALWVAVYRAEESERPDALFRDHLAGRLAGERGRKIARNMSHGVWTRWSLIIRTVVIDRFIYGLIQNGQIDTVINLGAGLDARPYRMDLSPDFRWIEVDFPHMIARKNEALQNEKPRCRLERIPQDLTNRILRRELFKKLSSESRSALILTEGVMPYLTVEQVAELAEDLAAQPSFNFWILDYLSPQVMARVRKMRWKDLKNAPFQFTPDNWFEFFKRHGWKLKEMRYLPEESEKLGRPIPLPLLAKVIMSIPGLRKKNFRQFTGFALMAPERSSN